MGTLFISVLLLFFVFGAEPIAGNGCPKGTFQKDLQCSQCPLGTFSDIEGALSCKSCPPESYTRRKASTSRNDCLKCSPGEVLRNNTCVGKTCPANTYMMMKGGVTECIPCPPGKISEAGSSLPSACFSCPPGRVVGAFRTRGGPCQFCSPGKSTTSVNAMECEDCPPGYTSEAALSLRKRPDQDGKCKKCRPGTYAETKGSPACKVCPIGFYQNAFGATSCEKCPPGSTTAAPGGKSCRPTCLPSESGCVWCAPGQGYNKQKKTCERCADGYVSTTATSTECVECPVGEAKANELRTRCVCESGYKVKKDGNCEKCRPRYISDGGKCICPTTGLGEGRGPCPCPKGQKPDIFNRNCIPADDPSLCPKGILVRGKCKRCPGESRPDDTRTRCTCGIGSGLRDGKCDVCRPGEFSRLQFTTPRTFTCVKCFRSTYSDKTGATVCKTCPSGQRPRAEGATACLPPCPEGAFRFFNDKCVCNFGSETVAGSDLNVECRKCGRHEIVRKKKCACPSGVFAGGECVACPENSGVISDKCRCRSGFEMKGNECVPCAAGTFGENGECRPCPSGKVTQDVGQTRCKSCNENFEAFSPSKCLPKCIKGFFRNADGGCESCSAGQVVVNRKCMQCPANSVSDGKDATVCTECTNGKVPNDKGDECV